MANTRILQQAEIFNGLAPEDLDIILSISKSQDYNTGDIIFEEGSASDELYVIDSGEVDIEMLPSQIGDFETHPRSIIITTLRRGQSFGEMALVSDGIRAATARCAQHDTRLIVIPRVRLLEVFEQNPRLGLKLMHNLAADLATKIRATDLLIQERVSWSNIR